MRKIKSIEDIKSGYVVKLRNGKFFMCMIYKQEKFSKLFVSKNGFPYIVRSYIGLKSCTDKNDDIVEVYGLSRNQYYCLEVSPNYRPLLYKEEKPKKMTISEIEEKLGYKIEVVSENK